MRKLILLTLALLALSAVADSTYTFRVVMTEDVWDGKDFTPTGWVFDDDGTPWILGVSSWIGGDTGVWALISDTLGNLDTLFANHEGNLTWSLGNYVLQGYSHKEAGIYAWTSSEDTFDVFDSLVVVKSIWGDPQNWKFAKSYFQPLIILESGWAFIEVNHYYPEADSLYSGIYYAISHYGELTVGIELPGQITVTKTNKPRGCNVKGSFLSILTKAPTLDLYNITVFDTSGEFLYEKETYGNHYDLLEDGSILFVKKSGENYYFAKGDSSGDITYELTGLLHCASYWTYGYNKAMFFIREGKHWSAPPESGYVFLFDITDTSINLNWLDSIGLDPYGTRYILPWGDLWGTAYSNEHPRIRDVKIRSSITDSVIAEWPAEPETIVYIGDTQVISNYLIILNEKTTNTIGGYSTWLIKVTKEVE